MMANGSDVGKLVELSKDKEALELKVLEYMDEWEELEENSRSGCLECPAHWYNGGRFVDGSFRMRKNGHPSLQTY